MKKFVIGMVVLLVVGLAVGGVGWGVYLRSDNRFGSKEIEYTRHETDLTQTPFDSIDFELAGMHNFTVCIGETYGIAYSDSEFNSFTVGAADGVLRIKEKVRYTKWYEMLFYKHRVTDIVVTVPSAPESWGTFVGKISGATQLTLPGGSYDSIALQVSGSSEIVCDGAILARDIRLDVSGSSEVRMEATADTASLTTSGSSAIDLRGDVRDLKVTNSGSTRLHCDGYYDQIAINGSGATEILLDGQGARALTASISGAGEIHAATFTVQEATFRVSGVAEVQIKVEQTMTIYSSGRAVIEYWGLPKIYNPDGNARCIKQD